MKLLSSLWCDNQPKKADNSAKIVPKRLTKFPFVKLFHKKKNEEQICGEGESVAQLYYYYIPILQFFCHNTAGPDWSSTYDAGRENQLSSIKHPKALDG